VFQYLSEIDQLKAARCKATSPEHFLNLDNIEEALKVNVAFKLDRIHNIMRSENNNFSKKDFTNLHYGLDITDMSCAHIKYVTFYNFKTRLAKGDIKCPNNLKNLENLCKLYGLYLLNVNASACFESGFF